MSAKVKILDELAQKHYKVDVRAIIPLERAGGNVRTDYGNADGSFQELVNSIRENGIKVPLRAYRNPENKEQWIAIDGHRRLKAAMILVEEGATMMAQVISVDARTITDEQLVIDMVVTNSGKPLSPLEMAEAVRRMLQYGYSNKDVAAKFGFPRHLVKNLEVLGLAPKRLRDLVHEKKVSYSLIVQILKECKDSNANHEEGFMEYYDRFGEKLQSRRLTPEERQTKIK